MGLNDTSGVSNYELIPDKTYCKVVLSVKPPKSGSQSVGMESLTKDGSGRYINIQAVVSEGRFKGKHLFGMLCTQPNGSEGHAQWENGSAKMLRSILEQARGAHKQSNPAGYRIAPDGVPQAALVQALVTAINGAEVIVKVSEKAGKDGFEDSNSFVVIPKWDNNGVVTKEFAGYSVQGTTAANAGTYQPPQGNYPPVGQQQYPAQNANYGGYVTPAQMNPAVVANPLAGSPPGFIDQNNADDIPFDPS